jgi:hypothetical protein
MTSNSANKILKKLKINVNLTDSAEAACSPWTNFAV